jgi:hypothetical protein
MFRKLCLIALAFIAARMAAKAMRREAEVISLLWTLVQMTAATGMAGTAKSRSTEDRLNNAMPRIPWPQSNPGGAGNSSYGINSGTNGIGGADNGSNTSNTGAGNTGGSDNGGVTSGQIGGASQHYHDMSHSHPGGAHQHSMAHGHAYGNLATDFNTLRNSYSDLVSSHNTLITKLASANILQ